MKELYIKGKLPKSCEECEFRQDVVEISNDKSRCSCGNFSLCSTENLAESYGNCRHERCPLHSATELTEPLECEYVCIDGDSGSYESGILPWVQWECSNCGYVHGEDIADCIVTETFNAFVTSYNYCPMCGAKIKKIGG